MKEKQLYRSCTNRILGGVCGGLGEYFDIDPVVIRLIFVLLAFAGVGIVTYLIAWIIVPADPACIKEDNEKKDATDEIREKAQEFAHEIRETVKSKRHRSGDGRLIVGGVLLSIGILALIQSVLHINLWSIFWPAILIIMGLAFLTRVRER